MTINECVKDLKSSPYFAVANQVVQLLPHVFAGGMFALKGGTAINLFYQNLPRLSVDIDLFFPVIKPRNEMLDDLKVGVERIISDIKRVFPNASINKEYGKEKFVTKLSIITAHARIALDINTIVRGSVYPVEQRGLTSLAQEAFQIQIDVPVLSRADVYGGKIVAALDRQHPRDLFDVRIMLDSIGLTDDIRLATIAYLLSSGRPTNEIIKPSLGDRRKEFTTEFESMTAMKFDYSDYERTRIELIDKLLGSFTSDEKEFFVGFTDGTPNWNLLEVDLSRMPAIQWKLQNLNKAKQLNPSKIIYELNDLKTKLGFVHAESDCDTHQK